MTSKNLFPVLKHLHIALTELNAMLKEEVNQLNRHQINPVSLQILSDSKSQLLATIQHCDYLRKQAEDKSRQSAPYASDERLAAQWQRITLQTTEANDMNNQVCTLIERHMQKNSQLQRIASQASDSASLYGAGGQSLGKKNGRVCNFTV